jgi:hypothetical protein
MKVIEWESEAPARLQEFRQILAEARFYYTLHPGSESQTRIWIQSDGKVGGKRMIGRFEMPVEFTWPIVDLNKNHPFGLGWMNFSIDQAFANAVRMRCDYWNHKAAPYMEVAS